MSPQSEKQHLPRTPRAGAFLMCHRPELGHVATQLPGRLGRWKWDCHVELGRTTWHSANKKERGCGYRGPPISSGKNPILFFPWKSLDRDRLNTWTQTTSSRGTVCQPMSLLSPCSWLLCNKPASFYEGLWVPWMIFIGTVTRWS